MACTITLSAGVPPSRAGVLPSETSPSSNESSSPSSPKEAIEPKVGEGDRGTSPPPVSACFICRLATSEQRYVMASRTATTREVGVGAALQRGKVREGRWGARWGEGGEGGQLPVRSQGGRQQRGRGGGGCGAGDGAL